jgi:dTDP-4-dehydrorhamnose reductase
MRVLVTGRSGQLGQALVRSAPTNVTVIALDHEQLDIADSQSVENCVRTHQPNVIVNAAAYTNVDKAEVERRQSVRVNTEGPRHLAAASKRNGTRLIHLSTDFVFDGNSSVPYTPESPTNPQSAYGTTKRDGEIAVLERLSERSVIVRTAWVYSAAGRNFVKTILRLLQEKGIARVVADQVGSPTSAQSLADAIWKVVGMPDMNGIHHWTDAGVASWYDFAVAIAEEASMLRLVPAHVSVSPIRTHEYETAARRPPYSVLDCRSLISKGLVPVHWRTNLRKTLTDIANAQKSVFKNPFVR